MNKIRNFYNRNNFSRFFLFLSLSLLCAGLGLILIYSAVKTLDGNFMQNQLIALALGVMLFTAAYFFDADKFSRLWFIVCILNFLFIFSLFFFGVGESNTSWLRIGSVGIQPAEIGKPIFIFTFSSHLDYTKRHSFRFRDIMSLTLHACAMIAAVVLFSRDDGMSLVYLFLTLIMVYAAGLKARWFFAGFALFAAASPLIWRSLLDDYQRARILAVFKPEEFTDISYQAGRSVSAIKSGGLTGMGYMKGALTQRSLIPTKHTDSIFAVAGEEFGAVGCMIIIFLLFLFIVLTLITAVRARDFVSKSVCTGIAAMFIFQTVLNIGMNLGLLPMIGLTLPFFSYGGSSLATMFISAGLVSGAAARIDNNKIFIYGECYEKNHRHYRIQ